MKVSKLPVWKLVQCLDLFLNGHNTRTIARELSRDWREQFSREDVYPILARARKEGLLQLRIPRAHSVHDDLVARYGLGELTEAIHVCDTRGSSAHQLVAEEAARGIETLIQEMKRTKDVVRIGLAGGRTVLAVVQHLAQLLLSSRELPKLAFHATCSGFNVEDPRTAPVAFLNYLAEVAPDVRLVGLFAPAMVAWDEYDRVKRETGVKESFDFCKDIDIVVTSLSAADDPHGPLKDLERVSGGQLPYLDREYRGDVAYMPYSDHGPIPIREGKRSVTLFDIPDLVDLAKAKGKEVVLVAGPCPAPGCGKARAMALRPLLENRKELGVWSQLYIDLQAAEDLAGSRSTR